MTSLDYDQHAAEYARHRRPYPGLVEHLIEYAEVDAGSSVLEMGCGTANHLTRLHELTGARAVGVDPSREMLKVAATQPGRLELLPGQAEDMTGLGLPEGAFDLIFSADMIHYVRDPARYFAEAFRLLGPGGVLATATDSEWVIRNRMPVAHYFPDTIEVELGRHHPIGALLDALRDAGFADRHERLFQSEYELTDATKYREKAFSSLHLISQEAFEAGLAALTADLAKGPIRANNRTCAVIARRPG